MDKSIKLSNVQIMLKTNLLYVRFQTKHFFKSGLLQELSRKRDGKVTCVFKQKEDSETVSFNLDDLIDVVVFCTEDFKPVFLKDFQAERRERNY